MASDLVMTVDVGTGSSRACVYALEQNRLLGVATRDCPIEYPGSDRAEWQPDRWWRAILEAMSQAVVEAGRPSKDYLGVTATSLRQGFVLLDDRDVPVAPGVLNYDRRGADYIPLVERAMPIEDLYRLTGHWHAPELTLPKLLWFKYEQPEIWRETHHFLFVHDWLVLQLTGQHATAESMITAGQMGDCTARDWAFDLLDRVGIRSEILPPVLPGGAQAGELLPKVAYLAGLRPGLPVFAGGGDTQFSCLGAGGMGPGKAVIVGGSTTPIMMTTDHPLFDRLRYPWVSPHLRPGLWAVETNAGHTGMLYKWLRDTLGQTRVAWARAEGRGDYDVLDDLAAQAPLGADGLLVVATSPRWAQDTWQRKAPYVFHNFKVSHGVGHIARAIMEGVCYGVRGNLDQLERVAGQPFKEVIFTGGSARVPFWAQMMADVSGRALNVPGAAEPSARAGAQLVAWAAGRPGELPRSPVTHYEPDPALTEAYEPVYWNYVQVFEKMQQHFAV